MHNAKNDDETRQNLKTDRPRQYAECHVSDHAKGLMLERVLSHRPKPGFRRMVEMSTTPNPTSTSRRNYVPKEGAISARNMCTARTAAIR